MPPPVLENMGQYVSPREVLLKAEGDVFNWVRLADQAMLQAGDRCLSLPTYRPVVRLGEDLHLQLVDATHLLFLPNEPLEAEKAPGILVDHGRLVLATEGRPRPACDCRSATARGLCGSPMIRPHWRSMWGVPLRRPPIRRRIRPC